jgi:hypothetical protein
VKRVVNYNVKIRVKADGSGDLFQTFPKLREKLVYD